MCAIAPASQQLPAASLASTPAPAIAAGGGATTMSEPTLAAAVQALAGAVSTLASILGAAGPAGAAQLTGATQAVSGGGALGAPMAAGTADAGMAAMEAGDQHEAAGHAGRDAASMQASMQGMPAGMKHMPGMDMVQHKGPEDRAKATKILDAVTSFFSKHGRAGLKFPNNQTHGKLSDAERTAFQRQFPGLPAPDSLVFPTGSNKPMGVVFRTSRDKDFDLGMGSRHVHSGHKEEMQHVWFTPGNVDLAYSDVRYGMTGATAKVLTKAGYYQR